MDGQDNMKERLLVLSQRMARRKSPKQKKRTLYQLSEMFSALGYRVTLMGKRVSMDSCCWAAIPHTPRLLSPPILICGKPA